MSGIPLSVWEEIPTIIVFALLILIIGKLAMKEFRESIGRIEATHLESIDRLNKQYLEIIHVFDARWQEQTEQISKVNSAIVAKLEQLGHTIDLVNRSVRRLNNRFEAHDLAERRLLDNIEAEVANGLNEAEDRPPME